MSTTNLLEGDQATKDLSARLSGSVYLPCDTGYSRETAGFNLSILHSPDLVAGVATTQDVVEVIRYARANNLKVSVQATGHGAYKPVTSGVLITTSRLNRLSIDPDRGIARIGAGVRWAAVLDAAEKHGLTAITGSSATVGVVGFLLGGGLGPLNRSHGFGADYVESLTVVTGEGEVIQASADSNPDLFWALRGGKNGLGIVTEVHLRLVRIPSLYAGALLFAEEHIETALRSWVDWSKLAPANVTTSVAVLNLPPFEFIPEPLRGRRLLALRFAFPGELDEGERLAAAVRAFAPVYIDTLGALPASQISRVHNDPTDPCPSWVMGMMLRDADQDLASELLARVGSGTQSPFLLAEIRHMGEASSRDVSSGSAVGGRNANYTLTFISMARDLFGTVLPAMGEEIRSAFEPWYTEEHNINFLGSHRVDAHSGSAWCAAKQEKLTAIRKKYDPSGLFD